MKKNDLGNSSNGTKIAPPNDSNILVLAAAMKELASSLNNFVAYMRENPEISAIPAGLKEIAKRIAVLSTRL